MVVSRVLVIASVAVRASVIDDGFDCGLRHVALDYAREVVLKPWSTGRAEAAERLVAQGLNIAECGASPSQTRSAEPLDTTGTSYDKRAAADAEAIFVSPSGDDDAAGTVDAITPVGTPRGAGAVAAATSAGSAGAQAVGAQRIHSDISSDLALLALRPSHGCDTLLCEGNIESHCLPMSSDSS